MESLHIVVIGSSAGGFSALEKLVASLSADFTKTIFIVQHFAAETVNYPPEMLDRVSKRNAVYPANVTIIRPENIYIVPSDLSQADRRQTDYGQKRAERKPVPSFY